MAHEGGLWHVARLVMTVKLPAACLTALEVSLWCYGIDIVSGCKGLGSLLMRAQIDQAVVALPLLWMMLIGCPLRPDLPTICITDGGVRQTHSCLPYIVTNTNVTKQKCGLESL